MPSIDDLQRIAEIEFADIVTDAIAIEHKLRIFLTEYGFIDVNLSQRLPGKFGFHWEVMDAASAIFRYDNFPDKNWDHVSTYPYHFHNGSQDKVEVPPFPLTAIEGFREFMEFVRSKIKEWSN
jgi:hypothetical protein